MNPIDAIRDELLEDGYASKMLLDYIDERIAQAISNRLVEGFADVEERLLNELREQKSR